jgi:pimeloyl-ACP methyl ester carboxylesterase
MSSLSFVRQVTVLLALIAISASAGAQPGGALEMSDCRIEHPTGQAIVRARCGTLAVPLDPDEPDGATLALRVARVPALNRRDNPVALTILAGGPGQAATDFYAAYRPAFERVREQMDIVLVDQRGTGQSHRLGCPVPEQSLGDVWSVELTQSLTRECLAKLDVDSRYFTTSVAVRDLDLVREALGYQQFSVYGVSYGTRVAQHYLRRFPERTHSAILDGVVPVDLPLGPDIAPQAQRALDLALGRCAEDAGCSDAYPHVRRDFRNLSETLKSAPVSVTLADPLTAVTVDVNLGYLDLAGAVRLLSYSPQTVALLPLFINQAAQGNYQPITAQALALTQSMVDALAFGMHNSVICAEDVPFIADADLDGLDATYLGTLLVDSMRAVCEIWPRGVIDDDFKTPFASAVPVLVMSGEADPITPPAYGERATAYLGNARHLVGPGQGHGQAGVGCVPRLMGQFVSERSLENLDLECIDVQGPEPFFTSFNGPQP